MKKWWKNAAAVICLLLFVSGIRVQAAEAVILDGVSIEGVDVSGMTKEEAVSTLEDHENVWKNKTITVKVGDHDLTAPLSTFGIVYANEETVEEALKLGKTGNIIKRYKVRQNLKHEGMNYTLNRQADRELVRVYVEGTCAKYDQPAKNASLKKENGSFTFVAGEKGLVLNAESAIQMLVDYLENSWSEDAQPLELPVQTSEPEGSAEELAYVQDLLGTFTTSYTTSHAARSKNVTSGTEHINGTILYPGEEFSTYEVVAPFTEENGYAMAGSYLNGEVVDSMGGGICQVSTTLYNAVLRAELEVTERSPHSMTVNYVSLSEDAAIAGTYKDFKFKNSTEYPIYVEGITTSDKRVTFNIYGKETRDPNRTISFESVMVSKTEPNTVLREDAGQGIGYKGISSGKAGYLAELYKVVKVNGVETERIKINKSRYQGSDRVITYGTAGDPVWSENLRAAIAAQDEALADANIAAAVPMQ